MFEDYGAYLQMFDSKRFDYMQSTVFYAPYQILNTRQNERACLKDRLFILIYLLYEIMANDLPI